MSETRKTHLLFICSQNKWRSPTAEALFANSETVEAISAGTNNDAETPVSGDLIEWADHIYVMERTHRKKVTAKFREQLRGKELSVLGIPDNYPLMDDELVEILKGKLLRWL